MSDEEFGSLIVYNGEVYNHMTIRESLKQRPFTSRTDTETILKGWSERGPAILRGFAWDVCARYVRFTTEAVLLGAGSSGNQAALYLPER